MAFEDFLRSVPLVHKHIMRTRRLMHENRKLRDFVEFNGLKSEDIISGTGTIPRLVSETPSPSPDNEDPTLASLAESLRVEQKRFAELQAQFYILQIDYDDLLKRSEILNNNKARKTRKKI